MVNRRSFTTSGIALLTALAVAPTRGRATTPSAGHAGGDIAIALVDRHLDGGAQFAADARARGLRTLEFTRDVADLWMREIEPRLRVGPIAVAGYTSAATAFCLGVLARDYGACMLQRAEHGAAVSFVISQYPGRRAALAPAAVRAQWSDTHA